MTDLSAVLERIGNSVRERERLMLTQPLGSTKSDGMLTTAQQQQGNQLDSPQEAKESLPTNTSRQDLPSTSQAARSEEIADMVSVCYKALDTFGKTPDQMHATVKLFCMVLEGQPVDKVRAAFRQWVKTNSKLPTPADIMNIIEPPVEEWKPDWSFYNALTRKIQNEGYYVWGDEREFRRRCEDYAIQRMRKNEEPCEEERQVRQLALEAHK